MHPVGRIVLSFVVTVLGACAEKSPIATVSDASTASDASDSDAACPVTAPRSGERCDGPTTSCEYRCDGLVETCRDGRWEGTFVAAPPGPSCPASPPDAGAPCASTCPVAAGVCSYGPCCVDGGAVGRGCANGVWVERPPQCPECH